MPNLVQVAYKREQQILLSLVSAGGGDAEDMVDFLWQLGAHLRREFALPCLNRSLVDLVERLETLFEFRPLGMNPFLQRHFAGRTQFEAWLVVVVEERDKLVVFALLERVELVIVALGAANCQTEERRSRRIESVINRIDAELFEVNPAFLVNRGVAVKARGDFLFGSGIRQ